MTTNYPEDIEVYLIAVDNLKLEIEISEQVIHAGQKVIDLIVENLKLKKVINANP